MAALRRLRLPASPVEGSALARLFVLAATAVATLSVVVYGQDYVVPLLALPLAAAGHRSSWSNRDRPRGRRRQALIAGLIFGCLFYFVADSVGAIFGGQLPQANFALLLVAVTSFDLKTRRNLYSSLWITLAVLYLAAIYAWDYPFGVFAAAWTVCLAGFWAASHLRRWEARPALPPRPALALAGGALLAGLAAFALLPQPTTNPPGPLIVSLPSSVSFKGELENPALPLVQFGQDPSGAANSVDLRYRGRLGGDVVMYVRTGAPAYWRGLVFDTYRDGVWTASHLEQKEYPPYVEGRLLGAPAGAQQGTFVQVVRVVRPLPGVIYAASPVESIYFPARAIRRDFYGAWRAPEPLKPGQTYSVVSYLPDYRPAALQVDTGPDDLQFAADTNAQGLSGPARALALQATAGADSRYDKVMALTTYLQRNYRYSLQLGHVPAGRDPVDWFLFDARIGYCEQFATAETLMLRSLGIPARVATGYSTGQYDPVLDQAVVRAQDAHAWVEVYFKGHGWVPVDPSPGYPSLAAARFPDRWAAAGLAHLVPHLSLGGAAGALGPLGAAAAVPALLGLLALAAIALAWLSTRSGPRRRRQPGEEELLRLYDRLQRRLGRRRAAPQTPAEYARSVAAGSLGELLAEVTEAVNRGAYAGRWPEAARLASWRARLRGARLS